MSSNTGIPYEILTKEIFEEILRQDEIQNVAVRHNVILKGITAEHQVDVYWKFEVGGIHYETIVQAKDWNKPVDQGELLKFRSVLDDIPGQPRGVFVTRTGYQHGAEEYAKSHGILLYVLFEEEPNPIQITTSTLGFARVKLVPPKKTTLGSNETVAGWFWEIVEFDTETRDGNFRIDHHWMDQLVQRLGAEARAQVIAMSWNGRPHEIEFYDEADNVTGDLQKLYRSIVVEMRNVNDWRRHIVHKFQDPTFIKTSSLSLPRVKVEAVESSIEIREKQRRLRPARRKGIVTFVLKNLVSSTRQLFERDTHGIDALKAL